MGAIAGVVYPPSFPVSFAVKPALDVLGERSSGEAQTYLFKNVELGSRTEPIGFDHHRTIAVGIDNGIQNIPQLAEKLKQAGFRPDGLSIAQLVVRAYDHWGMDFVDHLEGTFAIALYDQKKEELILVRDRMGIKPLYWAYRNRYFIFGSELKAVLATGLIPQAAAEEAIGAYFFLGYIPQNLSPIEGVNKLLPGHRLRLGKGGDLSVQPYWLYSQALQQETALKGAEVTEKLDEILQRAINREVRSGSLGFSASGSAGSACVGHYLAREPTKERTTALSLDIAAQNQDEVALATSLAGDLALPHRTVALDPSDLLKELPRIVWHLDEPCADPSAFGVWKMSQQSHGSAETLFFDVGCEEIAATHPRYHMGLFKEEKKSLSGKCLRTLSHWMLPLLKPFAPTAAFHFLRDAHVDPWLADYVLEKALFKPAMLNEMSPEIAHTFNPEVFLQRFYGISGLQTTPSAYLYLDTKTVLADKMLLQCDRLTAPHGVDWRSPFLDQEVVEFMAALSEEEKLHPDEAARPLRRLLDRFYPQRSFSFSSFDEPGILTPLLHDAGIRRALEYLEGGTLVEAGWLSRKWLRVALSGRMRPRPTFNQLWSLLSLEVWFRLYINRPISAIPPDETTVQLLQR